MPKPLNPMQRRFAKHYAATGNAEFAATKAGYSVPHVSASQLTRNDRVMQLTREEIRKFLREDAPAIAVGTMVEIATDPKQPPGARVNAADRLGRWSGVSLEDANLVKDPGEMTGDELDRALAIMTRQRDAMERVKADRAKPIIEAEPGVFD